MSVWFAPAQDHFNWLPTCIWLSVRLLASSQKLNVDALCSASKSKSATSWYQNDFRHTDYVSPSRPVQNIYRACMCYARACFVLLKTSTWRSKSFCPPFCAPIKSSHQYSDADKESFFDDTLPKWCSASPCLFSLFAFKLNTRNMNGCCYVLLKLGDDVAMWFCPPSGLHQNH